ncbi:hypothetical protein M0805_005200 [Coniferiporia weirii]|nr:hypothetical protein M0805_005200 [Coniferiporia weirii]
MPVHKGRNATGRLQHQRNLSGGSSRVGLNNLQLTQKDPVQSKQQQLKRAGHSAVELLPARTTSPFPRPSHLNSNARIHSKERISTQKRAAASAKQQPVAQNNAQNHRAGFSLAHSDGTDDEEWVSSESGAATPQNDEDDDDAHGTTPVDRQRVEHAPNGGTNRVVNGTAGLATPRSQSALSLTRVETARPETSPQMRAQVQAQPPTIHVQPQSTHVSPTPPPVPPVAERRPDVQLIRHTRSEAPSPTHLSQRPAPRRHPLVRHASTHGESKAEMPPHPLIRGQSYHGALKPAPLVPLSVNMEAAQAQLSASPTNARVGSIASSPSYMTQSFTQSPSEGSTDSRERVPTRKVSSSSLHSVATLPAPSSTRFNARTKQDRIRALSTISLSSSSAALDSLNKLPAMSRPGTPPLAVHFPSESRRDVQDGYHQLLPPMYSAAHATVLARYNPLQECYERVMRAKHGR